MNNRKVYKRLAKGYYIGRTLVDGELEKSIFREYIEGIVEGLTNYYEGRRTRPGDRGLPLRDDDRPDRFSPGLPGAPSAPGE